MASKNGSKCSYINCSNNSVRNKNLSFFRFPTKDKEREEATTVIDPKKYEGITTEYKMMYAERQMAVLNLALVLMLTCVAALPNHLKAVVVDTDPDPIPVAKKTVVSASFGGYSAKAGLGGSGTTGGLFAEADSPHGSASAGLGGSVAGSSASGGLGASASTGGASASTGDTSVHAKPSGGHKPVYHGPGLFDNIFNIPISVLQAVNTYLNNRGPVTKPVHRRRGHKPVVYETVTPLHGGDSTVSGAGAKSGLDRSAAAEAEAAGAPGAAGAQHDRRPVIVQKRVNYDDIFNIPISALKSVNQLLNNGKK